jgi:hypothetical protein
VLGRDGLEHTTQSAWLPPDSVSQLATGVKPLVLKRGDKLEVRQLVVLLAAVLVVHLEACRDGAVGALPGDDVSHAEPPCMPDAVVTLGSGVAGPAGMLASHDVPLGST